MNLEELKNLLNQGFTAADLRALGIIPAARPNAIPDKPEPVPASQPEPEPEPVPASQPEPVPASQPEPQTVHVDPLAALTAKVDALTGMFQAAARQGVNTGGGAKVIDPMETAGNALAGLSGYKVE